MDGDSPLSPLPKITYFGALRERAPVMFDEAARLAAEHPEEFGDFASVFDLVWTITQALPDDRANLIPAKEAPDTRKVGTLIRFSYWKGEMRAKYGIRTIFTWPGEVIRELEEGLATLAMRGTTEGWRQAGCAAYDLLLRILATLFHEFEVVH